MENGLHITGQADDQVVDLVIADPKGRVLGLYRGANGEIAITAAEARFLLEALPAMIARAEYLDHMGPLPPMDPTEETGAATPDIEINTAADRKGQIAQAEESARGAGTTGTPRKDQGRANPARAAFTQSPQHQGRRDQRHRSGRTRAGQPWRSCEDTALISGYRAGQGVKDLARIHGRSAKAIELRLERLGVSQLPAARAPNAPHSVTCHA
jgi:hypothetical protein